VPAGIGHATEQDADRDQAEPDDVDVVRLELYLRQPQRWPGSQQRARRAPRRRLLSLAGGHLGRTGFDTTGPVPPRHRSRDAGASKAAAVPSAYRMADYERTPRVLVVEDDDAIAQVLQRSLRMEGYEVRIAGDGTTALDE